jgi:gamma-glutamyl-gamma-aminobutyrate hydrolase PuuD
MKKPVIAINANLTKDGKRAQLAQDYSNAVYQAGGLPMVLPPLNLAGAADISVLINQVDGLVLSGATDIAPEVYQEKVLTKTVNLLPGVKQAFDLQLVKLALKKKLPILGICYGCQLINVVLGGTLFQDIRTQTPSRIKHRGTFHKIYICEGTLLYHIIGKNTLEVNSRHHQAIKTPGKNLMINARSEDTGIEGVEIPYYWHHQNGFCLGVQWHPESIAERPEQLRLFTALIKAARGN